MAWLKAQRVNEGAAWEFEELQCMHFIDPIDVPCSFIIFYCYENRVAMFFESYYFILEIVLDSLFLCSF